DHRWERTKKAYDLLVNGQGESFDTPQEALKASYDEDVTDEFITPKLIDESPESRVPRGDVVVVDNIRGDRARQITRAHTEDGCDGFETQQDLDLHYAT